MNDDETFAHQLRARVDRAAPAVDVDTDAVLPRARRRRARRMVATGVASVGAVALAAGWVAQAQPWEPTTAEIAPAAPGPASSGPVDPTPTADPEPEVVIGSEGWPDADYWYVRSTTTTVDGEREDTYPEEGWYGRTDPGIVIRDDDAENPIAFGPVGLWGTLLVDDEWVHIGWDALEELPTDPAQIEAILYDSVQEDRSVGTPDDKVLEMATELLTASPAPPPLRDAVWEVVTGLPGAVVEDGATDTTGRPGARTTYQPAESGMVELVYSPTERLLLERTVHGFEERADDYLWTETFIDERPAHQPPIEPTLEMAGCANWETC